MVTGTAITGSEAGAGAGLGAGMLDVTSAGVLSDLGDKVREAQCEDCMRSQKKSPAVVPKT